MNMEAEETKKAVIDITTLHSEVMRGKYTFTYLKTVN